MKLLEDRIRKDGIVREGNVLKVDSFINHQMDTAVPRDGKRVEAPVCRQAHQQSADH